MKIKEFCRIKKNHVLVIVFQVIKSLGQVCGQHWDVYKRQEYRDKTLNKYHGLSDLGLIIEWNSRQGRNTNDQVGKSDRL